MPARFDREFEADEPRLLSTVTLVLWTGCLAVGIGGLRMAYERPRPPPVVAAPVRAEILNVVVTRERMPAPVAGPPLPADAAPAPPAVPLPEQPPQIAPVDMPPPETALAKLNAFVEHVKPAPVIRSVAATRASTPATQPARMVQELTLGEGEGAQPMPEYPREAQIARQEGTVVIRFGVATDGSVENVAAISPCAWPLLNQAAIRAVRDTWRFTAGPPRLYEVSIRFQLRRENN
jgi:TonB family protein